MNKLQAGYVRFINALSGGMFATYFQEAIALQGTDELDEGKYRRLTSKQRDLKPMEFKKVMDLAFYLWQRNPMARRMIDIILDFTVGNDLQVNIRVMKNTPDGPKDQDRPEPQELWQKFCDDPVNNFYDDIDVIMQDFLIFGESLLPVALNPANKLPRLGYIDVGLITKVKRDISGRVVETVFVTNPEGGYDDKPFEIIRQKAPGQWVGEAFYFQNSKTLTKERGQSFLIEELDWIDGLDQFMMNNLEGSAFRNAFFYDLTMKGATAAQIKQAITDGVDKPPKPGTVRVHNDAVEWDVVSPELHAAETSEAVRMHKNYILAGKGFPEHWFSDGGNTNLATAEKMDAPVMQMLKRQQKKFKAMISTIARYVVEIQAPGYYTLGKDEYLDIQVMTPDLERSDAAVMGNAFTAVVGALSIATEKGWVSHDKAKEITGTIISRYGVKPDEDNVDAIREKNKASEGEDDLVGVGGLYDQTLVGGGPKGRNGDRSKVRRPDYVNQ